MYDAFIEILKQYALQAISGFRGLKLWVAKLVVKLIINTLKELGVAVNERIKAEQRLKEYEAIINNPETTPEQRRDADRDFLR